MKKILFFSNSIDISGLSSVLITYANLLCDTYSVVYVYCSESIENKKKFDARIHSICLNINRFRRCFIALYKTIKKERPDIIYTGGEFQNLYCIFANWLAGGNAKVLISQHNYLNIEYNSFIGSTVRNICYKLYNLSDRVIAISRGINDFLITNGVNEDKISIVYNPIDIDRIEHMSKEPIQENITNYFVFIGRLSVVKNLYFLIDSFEKVLEKKYDYHLMIIGDGPEKTNLAEYVNKKGLNTKVLLIGPRVNPYPYLKKSTSLMLPSLSEAVPSVVLESFVLGKTVVSTPNPGGIDLLKNGKLGYISKSFNDIEEFSDLMIDSILKPVDPKLLILESRLYSFNIKKSEILKDFD